MDEKKLNPGSTGMVIACLIAVFIGLYMVGTTMTAESDALRARLGAVSGQLEALSVEVRTANDKIDHLRDELRIQAASQAKAAAQQADQAAVQRAGEPAATNVK